MKRKPINENYVYIYLSNWQYTIYITIDIWEEAINPVISVWL